MSSSQTTTDHDTIKRWAEARDGHPSVVETGGPGGILRIDFGPKEERLEPISWDEFFKVFEDNDLAFLYQDETGGGGQSRFNKFIKREG